MIERMCAVCKQEYPPSAEFAGKSALAKNEQKKAIITRDNVSDFILYRKSMYHKECFMWKVEKERAKKTTAIYKHLLTESLEDFVQRLSAQTIAHCETAFVKDDIYNFIRELYAITTIPSYIFTKLQDIYDGTYKGMSVGIPPEHLLDMWKRKAGELERIASQNITKGKALEADRRLSYDLSILINKYDSYLKWLNKQKIIAAESRREAGCNNRSEKIDFTIIEKQSKANSHATEKDEMDKYLEELF